MNTMYAATIVLYAPHQCWVGISASPEALTRDVIHLARHIHTYSYIRMKAVYRVVMIKLTSLRPAVKTSAHISGLAPTYQDQETKTSKDKCQWTSSASCIKVAPS